MVQGARAAEARYYNVTVSGDVWRLVSSCAAVGSRVGAVVSTRALTL